MKARLIHLFIVWFAVYVTVTLSLLALRRLAPGMPLWANTLMLTMILVPTIMFVIAPFAGRTAARFAGPKAQ